MSTEKEIMESLEDDLAVKSRMIEDWAVTLRELAELDGWRLTLLEEEDDR